MTFTEETLKQHVRETYAQQVAANDLAHRWDHFEEVHDTALAIQNRVPLDVDPLLAVAAAFYHDLWVGKNRKTHHVLAALHITKGSDAFLDTLSAHDRHLLGFACYEHRASYDGTFTSPLSELISSADRGPISEEALWKKLQRSYLYQLEHGAESPEQGLEMAVAHIHNKYSRGGYARFPLLYVKAFAEDFEPWYDRVDRLTVEVARPHVRL